MRSTALLLATALAGTLVPATATAQQPARTLVELDRRQIFEEGSKVRVTCLFEQGGEYEQIEAELVSLTEHSLEVRVGKLPARTTDLNVRPPSQSYRHYRIEIPEDRIQKIETRGPARRRGTLIGAAAGGAWGAVMGQYAEEEGCDGCQWAMIAVAGASCAGIGYLIDRACRGWEPVFLAEPELASSVSLSIAPLISTERRGVLLSISW